MVPHHICLTLVGYLVSVGWNCGKNRRCRLYGRHLALVPLQVNGTYSCMLVFDFNSGSFVIEPLLKVQWHPSRLPWVFV